MSIRSSGPATPAQPLDLSNHKNYDCARRLFITTLSYMNMATVGITLGACRNSKCTFLEDNSPCMEYLKEEESFEGDIRRHPCVCGCIRVRHILLPVSLGKCSHLAATNKY
jgi:hypothetical protein